MKSTRRAVLSALAAVALAGAGANAAHASDALKVKVQQGKLHGEWSSDHQVREFLGVPYAAPPVGSLRWQPPMPGKKWHGLREATGFGSHCMQATLFNDIRFRDPGQSEDCLSLNVWAPAAKKGEKLPVMVWIYGGGFQVGATSEPRQDGEHLAHKGVIVVSMNYRLGVFGFFAGAGLAAESPHHAAGNYGLMDQAAAIDWVHNNIEKFGGDPSQITIFGESAGSFSVSTQMAAPRTEGLIARAIGESGGAFGSKSLGYKPLTEREQSDDAFMQSAFGTTDVAKLRAISADDLLKAVSKRGSGAPNFSPDVDGWFLPESVPAIYAAGKQAHVPLLAGWNRDEGSFAMMAQRKPVTVESFEEFAKTQFPDNSEEFLKVYSAGNDADAARAQLDYAGDAFIAYSTWAWLEAQVKTGQAPVYRYLFAQPSPGDAYHPGHFVFHSDDIEYVFGTLDSRTGAHWTPEDYKLSDDMQTYWTDFAKTGNPNGGDLPKWPQYDEADQWQVMHLQPNLEAEPDQHRDRDLFLQKVWGHGDGK